jgi:pyruvate formate lyase activating enzyme
VPCGQCGAGCIIGERERSFCGLRTVRDRELHAIAGTPERGLLSWYRDPLPTNCVADWICSGSGQNGRHNLAVFYQSCTLDCLGCQNWQFREVNAESAPTLSAGELAAQANSYTYCACFFGGDPASQMPHALATAKLLSHKGVRVCWETAGTAESKLMDRALALSLDSGGCLKFDIKAVTEPLHEALAGLGNRQTLANFARAARRFGERPDPPLLVASTLLIPGYVDANEVRLIAAFIAEQDPRIPFALLGFRPSYLMSDLPPTSTAHAEEARQAAMEAGLKNVRIGNAHLLGSDYPVATTDP